MDIFNLNRVGFIRVTVYILKKGQTTAGLAESEFNFNWVGVTRAELYPLANEPGCTKEENRCKTFS